MRQLPPEQQHELDVVRNAIRTTKRYANHAERLKLIELVYWQTYRCTVCYAAAQIPVSYETARTWLRGFVELVDAYDRVMP